MTKLESEALGEVTRRSGRLAGSTERKVSGELQVRRASGRKFQIFADAIVKLRTKNAHRDYVFTIVGMSTHRNDYFMLCVTLYSHTFIVFILIDDEFVLKSNAFFCTHRRDADNIVDLFLSILVQLPHLSTSNKLCFNYCSSSLPINVSFALELYFLVHV